MLVVLPTSASCPLLLCAAACNNPVFSEIVPTHLRNLIFAFDRCAVGCA